MKSFLYILNITLPVILLLAIGFLYGSKKKINPKTLTDIVLFLLAPALIFHTLSTRNLNIQNIFEICFFSLSILLIPGLIATLIKKILKEVVGSQDQIAATYGGFNKIIFSPGGSEAAAP